MKDTAEQLGATMKGVFDRVRGDTAGRNLRDAYVAEHGEIAAHQLLERVATLAGDTRTADTVIEGPAVAALPRPPDAEAGQGSRNPIRTVVPPPSGVENLTSSASAAIICSPSRSPGLV